MSTPYPHTVVTVESEGKQYAFDAWATSDDHIGLQAGNATASVPALQINGVGYRVVAHIEKDRSDRWYEPPRSNVFFEREHNVTRDGKWLEATAAAWRTVTKILNAAREQIPSSDEGKALLADGRVAHVKVELERKEKEYAEASQALVDLSMAVSDLRAEAVRLGLREPAQTSDGQVTHVQECPVCHAEIEHIIDRAFRNGDHGSGKCKECGAYLEAFFEEAIEWTVQVAEDNSAWDLID